MRFLLALFLLSLANAAPALADGFAVHQARHPDLFDPQTGYRIARQRAPTPDDIPPPVELVGPEEAQTLLDAGALPLDVYGASQSRYDDLDGTWLVSEPRMSLPGALWLPETGRGWLEPVMETYLTQNLERATGGDRGYPIVVYCVADCWMSWNAAQRISGLGYARVYWFRLGTDGWQDIGGTLEPVEPVPVVLD